MTDQPPTVSDLAQEAARVIRSAGLLGTSRQRHRDAFDLLWHHRWEEDKTDFEYWTPLWKAYREHYGTHSIRDNNRFKGTQQERAEYMAGRFDALCHESAEEVRK